MTTAEQTQDAGTAPPAVGNRLDRHVRPRAWLWMDINGDTKVNVWEAPHGACEPLYGAEALLSAADFLADMHAANALLRSDVLAFREVLQRCVAGIDHLSALARLWEPDNSSGSDRRGWLLAQDARDDARKALAEHAARVLGPNVGVQPPAGGGSAGTRG